MKLLKGSKVLESGSIYKKVYKLHHRLWKPYQSGTDSHVNCEWVIITSAILSSATQLMFDILQMLSLILFVESLLLNIKQTGIFA